MRRDDVDRHDFQDLMDLTGRNSYRVSCAKLFIPYFVTIRG